RQGFRVARIRPYAGRVGAHVGKGGRAMTPGLCAVLGFGSAVLRCAMLGSARLRYASLRRATGARMAALAYTGRDCKRAFCAASHARQNATSPASMAFRVSDRPRAG